MIEMIDRVVKDLPHSGDSSGLFVVHSSGPLNNHTQCTSGTPPHSDVTAVLSLDNDRASSYDGKYEYNLEISFYGMFHVISTNETVNMVESCLTIDSWCNETSYD